MAYKKIKLVVTDLDGTLLNSRKEVPAGFEDWVCEHPEIKTVIASGRQYYNMYKLFPRAAERMIFIADNGGLVADQGAFIYTNTMKTETVKACVERFSDRDGHAVILCGEKSAYMKHGSADVEKNGHMYYERLEFTDDLQSCMEKDKIIKIAVFIEDYNAAAYYDTLQDIPEGVNVVLSGDCWLDIANQEVNKGAALAFLQKLYHIEADACMAFGDFLNDESMMRQCTESYAMSNAHPGLKEAAKYIAPSNEEAGVMKILSEIRGSTKVQAQIPAVNEDTEGILAKVECFALDMDGTIYLGEQWIDGAREFLAKIEASGRNYVFVTNNSSKNAAVYVEKLGRMGLAVGEEKIVTSGQATIAYLQRHYPGACVFLLGNPMLQAEFMQAGIALEEERPDVVVTAFDTTLDYAKMCKVCDHVRAGIPYLATHPDYNCPTESGFIPDAGAIHAFIHASAFRYPDRVIGKPNEDIISYLTSRVKTKREHIAMVGDRLYTDIAAGRNHGLKSVLVLSGEASLEDVQTSETVPHLIFSSVREMIPFL